MEITAMRYNASWRELNGRAKATTCGHLLCDEDGAQILSNNAACPVCDQELSQSLTRQVDTKPDKEWINVRWHSRRGFSRDNLVQYNMAMDGMPPQIAMETACRSVAFYTQKMELQMQCKMNRLTAQCRQKWEAMQEPFTSKLEQMNTAYQEKSERCQMIEQESLSKDNQELQEKISEISRQMRKLEETYNQLRNDFELMKVFAIEPANNFFFPRGEPDWFAGPANMGDNRDTVRKDWPVSTRGPREDIWPTTRPNSCNFGPFVSSPVKILGQHMRPVGRSRLGGQASMPLRYLILSPLKRPQPSQNKA